MSTAMHIDMELMEEYPFEGAFYLTQPEDESVSLLEQEDVTDEVLRVKCDIQQASVLGNAGFRTTDYNVYFPMSGKIGRLLLEKGGHLRGEKGSWIGFAVDNSGSNVDDRYLIRIRRGLMFRGSAFGYEIDGAVVGIGFSQLGGCVAQIKDMTE